jgi:hypothetical protein
MKDREIKELLIIMRDNIDLIGKKPGIAGMVTSGLCILLTDLLILKKITVIERRYMISFLNNHLPPVDPHTGYVWRIGAKAPRLRWLNEQIEKL